MNSVKENIFQSENLGTKTAAYIKQLEDALKVTANCTYRKNFHSDQGWAYQMKAYSRRLKEERVFQSTSRKGNCYDNAVMENFFGILKLRRSIL